MPEFEEFARDAVRDSRADPMFTLQARGLLSLNQAAFVALGEPAAVALLYDANEHIVGLRKVDAEHENGHAVRKQKSAQSYVVSAQAFSAHHGIPTPRGRRFPGVDYGNGVWGFALGQGTPVQNRRGASEPGTAVTDRWRATTNGFEVPMLMRVREKAFSHPGYSRSYADRPPSMRIGARLPCDPLGPTPPSTELRGRFLGFLTEYRVLELVSRLTHIDSGAQWRSMVGHGRLWLEAAMMVEEQHAAPVASAMLTLPDAGTPRHGGESGWAELVLHVEPRTDEGAAAPPLRLAEWRDRFTRALEMPQALAQFLAQHLDLATPAEPAAQLGIWLEAPESLTAMVDVGTLKRLPGSAQANSFIGYAVADAHGAAPAEVAGDLLAQMCEFTLHLDGWEQAVQSADTDTPHATSAV
jgi:hypothetical protein